MLNFGNLVINEWLKMYKKRSFFIPFAIMAVIIIGFVYLMKSFAPATITAGITSFDVINEMMNYNGLGQIITFLAIICTAGSVTKEHSQGTIKFLLIRSHSRSAILASKYVTVLLFIVMLTLFTLAVSFAAGVIVYGFEIHDVTWRDVLLTTAAALIRTWVYATITFMLGVFTRSTGATIGASMVIVVLNGLIIFLLSKYAFIKYVLFTNIDLLPYFYNQNPPYEGMTLGFSISVIAVYVFLFLAGSFVTFKKRDIA
ncbi:ABC-2 type transport system permease protein [Fontibacillus solani]|uniref:ABC-2 type transport system permease protein n=1 Tax=Fontibacillus solani TaxID=1572857 RepID=A0A7W3SQJ5_9BACL|nr:ABC transporter permease subunit [Fontibacillus solani]MBA9084387.1 ABC-2 type transport system permease protein [Fontibacillus solani]